MFRFTIRDAMWLTVVVGLGVAWWVDRRKLVDALDPKTRLEGSVVWVDETKKLVDVTLGFDDGVQPGDHVEVYRDSAEIGEVRLIEVKPDASRGFISSQSTQIQRGDRVNLFLRQSDLRLKWVRRLGLPTNP